VIPVASGSQLTKVHKAFRELIELGLVEDRPYRVFGAQATGCSPVATAYKDATAKTTLLAARTARLSQDSALVAYDAMSYQRISAGMGFTSIGTIGRSSPNPVAWS